MRSHLPTYVLAAAGGGDADWIFRSSADPALQQRVRQLWAEECTCAPRARCGTCKGVVCQVGRIPLSVADFKTFSSGTWLTDAPLEARFQQLQAHNDKAAGLVLELDAHTKALVPRVRILPVLACAKVAGSVREDDWKAAIRAVGLDSTKVASRDLWSELKPVDKLLIALNLSDDRGTLAIEGEGTHWAGLEINLGKNNETFHYWDSFVRRCHAPTLTLCCPARS